MWLGIIFTANACYFGNSCYICVVEHNQTPRTKMSYALKGYTQTGYGTYRVTIADADGNEYRATTHEVEAIDAIRAAGREMKSNDAGSYQRLSDEFAEGIAAILGLD